MSNVITFQPKPRLSQQRPLDVLMRAVSQNRRLPGDVLWLKENAELLNVLAATGEQVSSDALSAYAEFYDGIEERLRFYPQYYRFFLSMCLDLEDLGFSGDKGGPICEWVATTGLADAELSDLQRAEAQRLLARRGAAAPVGTGDLGDRLRQFAERPKTFALPNKKAAYELTHIVFYLSEYGQGDPDLGEDALQSLEFAGLIAYLDQNHDLLAEICTALRYVGADPSEIWTQAVAQAHWGIMPVHAGDVPQTVDAYHAYLVTGWAERLAGGRAFQSPLPEGGVQFAPPSSGGSALRPLSECLYELGGARSADWSGMKGRLIPALDAQTRMTLEQAEESTSGFEAFFEEFARAV
ncbi:MAG: hypothetical protein AB8B60_02845 [Sulfitobacter sp.]